MENIHIDDNIDYSSCPDFSEEFDSLCEELGLVSKPNGGNAPIMGRVGATGKDTKEQSAKPEKTAEQAEAEARKQTMKERATRMQRKQAELSSRSLEFTVVGEAPVPSPYADWLVDGIISRSKPVILAGIGEGGKGMLLSTLSCCLAAGEPFCGRPTRQGKVIFISAEDDANDLLSRIRDVAAAMGLEEKWVLDNIIIASTASSGIAPALFDKDMKPTQILYDVADVVEREQPVLVIVDTLAACAPSKIDMKDSSQATQYICGTMAMLSPEHGITPTVIFSHHFRKPERGNNARPTLNDVRDSSGIVGSARAVLLLHNNQLSLDKCNDRFRVDPEYRVLKTDLLQLKWKSAPCRLSGALVMDCQLSAEDIAEAEAAKAEAEAAMEAESKMEEAAIKKALEQARCDNKRQNTEAEAIAAAKAKAEAKAAKTGVQYALPS